MASVATLPLLSLTEALRICPSLRVLLHPPELAIVSAGASHMASAVPLPLPFFHDFHSNPASPEAQDQAQAQRALVTASPHLEEQMRTASEDAEGVSMGQGQLVADLAARSAGMPPPSHRLRRASVQICLMLDDRLEVRALEGS